VSITHRYSPLLTGTPSFGSDLGSFLGSPSIRPISISGPDWSMWGPAGCLHGSKNALLKIDSQWSSQKLVSRNDGAQNLPNRCRMNRKSGRRESQNHEKKLQVFIAGWRLQPFPKTSKNLQNTKLPKANFWIQNRTLGAPRSIVQTFWNAGHRTENKCCFNDASRRPELRKVKPQGAPR
jgi:hypothetical protein